MVELTGKIQRHLLPVVMELLADEPVVVVGGPRTVGKSVLLHDLAAAANVPVIDLDNPETRTAVEADPQLVPSTQRQPVLVDEYQHVPAVLDAIKADLTSDLRPGRFVLTGSTRYSAVPRVARALTGRAQLLTLWPFAQSEIESTAPPQVCDVLFSNAEAITDLAPSGLSSREYADRVFAGGFPLALRRGSKARQRWFASYVQTVIERDVLDLQRVRQRDVLPRLLRILAAQTGQLVNMSDIGRRLDLDRKTVGDYVRLLEAVYLVHRLPAWGRTLMPRATRLPKVHLMDSGVGAALHGLNLERFDARDPAALVAYGHLLETFAVNEVLKQAGWCNTNVSAYYFRTKDGAEVDLVLEVPDGRVAGIEVKAGSHVDARNDTRGLRLVRDKLEDLFVAGIVLHTGQRTYQIDDRIWAAPIDILWRL